MTATGEFTARPSATQRRPAPGAGQGQTWGRADEVLVRVHEPFTVLDLLDGGPQRMHSWPLKPPRWPPHGSAAAPAWPCCSTAATNPPQLLPQVAAAAASRAGARPADGPAHLRRGRADPARAGRAPHEAAGQPAPHAQHDRLRARSHRLPQAADALSPHRPIPTKTETDPPCGADQGEPSTWTAAASHRHRAGPLQRRITDASWPKPASPSWLSAGRARRNITPCHRARRAGGAGGAAGLADTDDFDALIALGCIIRGETYHFELVANESGAGVTPGALDYHLPIANAILTVENEAQAVGPRRRERPRRGARGRRDGQPAERDRAETVTETHLTTTARPRPQGRKPGTSARRRARELALQGLYQWLVGRRRPPRSTPFLRELDGFDKATACTSTPCCTAASPRPRRWMRRITPCRPQAPGPVAGRAWRADDRRLRAPALPGRALPRGHQRGGRAGQDPSAAPMATSTSTVCSTSWPADLRPAEVAARQAGAPAQPAAP